MIPSGEAYGVRSMVFLFSSALTGTSESNQGVASLGVSHAAARAARPITEDYVMRRTRKDRYGARVVINCAGSLE